MWKHLLFLSPSRKWSSLSLSVIAGTPESLVEATPQHLGYTHLRALYSPIHQKGHEPGITIYYTTTTLHTMSVSRLER